VSLRHVRNRAGAINHLGLSVRRPWLVGRCVPLPPAAGPQQVHLHLHDVSAEDVAAILSRVNREDL